MTTINTIANEGNEKHVPIIEKIENGYKVTVSSIFHPMTEEHYIVWIELITTDGEILKKELHPHDEPIAIFETHKIADEARAFCNLHGTRTSKK